LVTWCLNPQVCRICNASRLACPANDGLQTFTIMVGERVQMDVDAKAVQILPLIFHWKDPELVGSEPWGSAHHRGCWPQPERIYSPASARSTLTAVVAPIKSNGRFSRRQGYGRNTQILTPLTLIRCLPAEARKMVIRT